MLKKASIALLCLLMLGVFVPLASAQDAGGRLLVWIANGLSPAEVDPNDAGQLVYINSAGATELMMEVPQGTSRILPCGDGASADNQLFAFYMGGADGVMYLMSGTNTPVQVDEVNALTCLGSGTVQFSPNGTRLAYIDYADPTNAPNYSEGALRVIDTATQQRAQIRENDVLNTTAFDITNDAVAYIRMITDNEGSAIEAAVNLWNGTNVLEVSTLAPESDNDCRFTSASVTIMSDGRLLAVMGHRCQRGSDTSTNWKFYVIDPSTRSAQETMSAAAGGQFGATSRANNIYLSPDSTTAYFTIPDGVSLNTVSLVAVNLGDMSTTEILPRSAIMARHTQRPYDWADTAAPIQSTDGRWLAVVVSTPDGDTTLNVIDLSAPANAPITLSAGDRGATVGTLTFTPNGARVIYIAGGSGGVENSLFALELSSGSEFRVVRGRFGRGVISPDSGQFAVMEWQSVEDPQEPAYLTLAMIDVNTSAYTLIFTGAEIVDGTVTNPRFAYPLSWRPG